MTPEIKLPDREILISHVVSSLDEYWRENTELILNLPIQNRQNSFKLSIPLKMIPINLPNWGSSCGVKNQILVPQECVKIYGDSNDWREVDWWLAIFLMLEGWHERTWEKIHGSIHSYSYKLKGWDSRVWDRAWVNRICLFLRNWYSKHFNKDNHFLGDLPKPELMLSHDVDAVCKTHPIRIKQSVFHFFNSLKLLLQFRISQSVSKLVKGIKFLFSNEDWWVFDKLLKMEKDEGISAVYHFYSDNRSKNFKRWLMDPLYDVKDNRVNALLKKIVDAGHEVGLHPTYDAWNDSKLLRQQKEILEESLGLHVACCRQHWLRFSWNNTWQSQAEAGLQQDSTLMFNDRSGFRNSCATNWKPWDQIKRESHSVSCLTSVIMDSHLYDYSHLNEDERYKFIRIWIDECLAVCGQTSLLWHPQTLADDYGWKKSLVFLLDIIKKNNV